MSRQPRTRQPKSKFGPRFCRVCLTVVTIRLIDGRLVMKCTGCPDTVSAS